MEIINCENLSRPEPKYHYKKIRSCFYSQKNDGVTIIVLAYARLEKARACVENILKYTVPGYKLILLDNGTSDNSISDYFESVKYDEKKVVRFSKNITGVYALNKVFKCLDSEYVVMISDDIIVTPNWLNNLLICAESDESIGMVVPTSTNVSNLQLETLGGFENIEEMQEKAAKFNISDPRKWEEKIRLIPTATLYRREIFETVGMYDVGFMHDFGDDDFTFRVRRAGYKLMLCRDTFVHHDHDQTTLPQERIDIMTQSKEFFRDKYKGIDAWDDTSNYISFAYSSINFSESKGKTLLAIDVKCGVPILEMKNKCRANETGLSFCKAYSSDSKYFIDLQSVSDEVVCGNVESMLNDEEKEYDYVILGNPINTYSNPMKLLRKLNSLLKNDGYIIFAVRNTNNVISLLNMLGVEVSSDDSQPKAISYKDFLNSLSVLKYTNADVSTIPLSINQELNNQIQNLIISMDVNMDKESIYQNIMIQDYWITAHR